VRHGRDRERERERERFVCSDNCAAGAFACNVIDLRWKLPIPGSFHAHLKCCPRTLWPQHACFQNSFNPILHLSHSIFSFNSSSCIHNEQQEIIGSFNLICVMYEIETVYTPCYCSFSSNSHSLNISLSLSLSNSFFLLRFSFLSPTHSLKCCLYAFFSARTVCLDIM
jgi:hypothetical protein